MKKNPPGSFYRHILRDAWNVTRTHRSFWILGFFVSFLGVGGVYELLVQSTGRLGLTENFGSFVAFSALVPTGPELISAVRSLGAYNAAFVISVGLAALAFFAVAVWVIVTSQGALIAGVRDVDKKRKPKFADLFSTGSETFPQLLGLDIMSRLTIVIAFYFLLSLMLLLLAKATVLSSILYLLAFLVLMPFTLIIGFVTVYAAAYIVIQRLSLLEAVEAAFALFRRYWLISLETALFLFVINILVSLGVGFLFSAAGVLLLPVIIGASVLGAKLGVWLALALGVAAAVAALIVVGSGLSTFQYAVWTHLFMKLHVRNHGGTPKIVRLLGKIFR